MMVMSVHGILSTLECGWDAGAWKLQKTWEWWCNALSCVCGKEKWTSLRLGIPN